MPATETYLGKVITGYRTEYQQWEGRGGRDESREVRFAILEDGTEVDTDEIAYAEHCDWMLATGQYDNH